uniref:Fibronectin type-III domain-containing protein n=1 Tax=Romanomermis culicivorax TaxID=13658 RepID=A0A915HYR2_ROMCU
GDLSTGHEYDFRVIAKNDAGFSIPSESSRPIVIGMNAVPSPSSKTLSVSTLKDNLPPMNREGDFNAGYRDPTLAEVLEYLECTNNVLRLNATGYLQHLTFNDDAIKRKVRDLGGIPRLLQLLRVEMPEIQKNACGCLKNLSFGVDENKKAILNSGGITILANLLAKTPDLQVMDEIVGILSNLSSHEDLKLPILQNNVETLTKRIIIPYSIPTDGDLNGVPRPSVDTVKNKPGLYKGATGVLRNVSSSGDLARKFLRECDRLIESLIAFLRFSCKRSEFDSKSVENVTCILRNLSYRLQETEEKNGLSNGHDKQSNFERSKSAPSGSPKLKLRTSTKQKRKGNEVHNGHVVNSTNPNPYPTPISLLWSQDLVRDYLCLLEHSSNPETLEASAGAIQNLAACHW